MTKAFLGARRATLPPAHYLTWELQTCNITATCMCKSVVCVCMLMLLIYAPLARSMSLRHRLTDLSDTHLTCFTDMVFSSMVPDNLPSQREIFSAGQTYYHTCALLLQLCPLNLSALIQHECLVLTPQVCLSQGGQLRRSQLGVTEQLRLSQSQ